MGKKLYTYIYTECLIRHSENYKGPGILCELNKESSLLSNQKIAIWIICCTRTANSSLKKMFMALCFLIDKYRLRLRIVINKTSARQKFLLLVTLNSHLEHTTTLLCVLRELTSNQVPLG